MTVCKVAIVGAGIMGLAAARSLAKAGAEVTVFEAGHGACNASGGSHGKARVIRLTYGEPFYCRLAERAYAAWDDIAKDWGEPLYRVVGGLDIALTGAEVLADYKAALEQVSIPFKILDAMKTRRKFPQVVLPETAVSLYQAQTAILHADLCSAALQEQAVTAGVAIEFNTKVEGVELDGDQIRVLTAGSQRGFNKVVLCAGSGIRSWTTGLGTPLNLVFSREQVSYFPAEDRLAHDANAMPILIFHLGENVLSSVFPILRDDPVKAMVENNGRVSIDAEELNRVKVAELQELILPNLPLLEPVPTKTDTCHYVLTEDNDFVIDRLPEASNVVVCSACSGHGFKFAPVLGNLVRDLILTDDRPEPRFAIDFVARPGLAP